MTPLLFLESIFSHPALASHVVAIWDRQTKRTEAFRIGDQLPDAAQSALTRSQDTDVYVGTCPYTHVAPGGRGNAGTASALVALWIDIDIYDEVAHRNTKLPPNQDAALDLLKECDRPASITLATGYGLQAWWLLAEPFLITDDATRARAAKIARGWVDHVRGKAARHGWHVDPVGDLARVLRIPGTWNRKATEAKGVVIVS